MTWSRRKRPAEDRFWELVDQSGDCWVWMGATDQAGYGRFGSTPHRMERAHRFAYETEVGPIPPGMFVMHRCDNPPCVRPSHLAVGTALDNNRDATQKLRNARGDRHGRKRIDSATAALIRSSRAAGRPLAEVAATYGVSEATVSRIAHGLIWKDLL